MRLPAVLVAAATVFGAIAAGPAGATQSTVDALAGTTHFHGIAAVRDDPSAFYLATHHGLWRAGTDGRAELLSERRDDFMGFTPHPTDSSILFASGHPAGGGNLGVIVSTDRGRTWRRLSGGVRGPVDFHQMDVSKADPTVMYGVHGGLQRSGDGGRSWSVTGSPPQGLIAIAASARDADTLYAATQGGLLRSGDGGRSWGRAHPSPNPASVVHVAADGRVYAFLLGTGLVRAADAPGALSWQVVSGGFDGYLMHLAVAAGGRRLFAVAMDPRTRRQSVTVSVDGGASWGKAGGRR